MEYQKELGLISAARTGNVKLAKLLLEQGCDINVLNEFGATPLSTSLYEGRFRFSNMLIENGAEVEINFDKNGCSNPTPVLFEAILNGMPNSYFKKMLEKISDTDKYFKEIKEDKSLDIFFNILEEMNANYSVDKLNKSENVFDLMCLGFPLSDILEKHGNARYLNVLAKNMPDIFPRLLKEAYSSNGTLEKTKNTSKSAFLFLFNEHFNINNILSSDKDCFLKFIKDIKEDEDFDYRSIIDNNIGELPDALCIFLNKENLIAISNTMSKETAKEVFDTFISDGFAYHVESLIDVKNTLDYVIKNKDNDLFNIDKDDIDRYRRIADEASVFWYDSGDSESIEEGENVLKILEVEHIKLNQPLNQSKPNKFKI